MADSEPAAASGYDVVGDIHGCAEQLVRLLEQLGYSKRDGVWQHPTRKMLFLGDFVDRGPGQLKAVRIPMNMVRAGSALAVAGNHEFNAIAYATTRPDGGFCRPHTDKNVHQHRAFIDAVGFGSDLHREIIDWFRTLPVALGLDGLRAVHACWHDTHIRTLEAALGGERMTDDFIVEATTNGTALHEAAEVVLKGPEADLNGYWYRDKDGHRRDAGRVEWWRPDATTLRDAIRLSPEWTVYGPDGNEVDQLPDDPLPEGTMPPASTTGTVTFFGHYWFDAAAESGPSILETSATCLDWSAVKGGPLVAYRWSGKSALTAEHLTWVEHTEGEASRPPT